MDSQSQKATPGTAIIAIIIGVLGGLAIIAFALFA